MMNAHLQADMVAQDALVIRTMTTAAETMVVMSLAYIKSPRLLLE
jgi:hypothetical protein